MKGVEKLEISQGRRSIHALVARIDRSSPAELREVSITLPEAITESGFYSDTYAFLAKVVENDK